MVFFVGDVLMSARLILVGIFAIIDRLRKPHRPATAGFNPRVAVLVPAYNEEKVIVRTIRSVLNSDYANLHVIVIDDGSKRPHLRGRARCLRCARSPLAASAVLTKPNGGKAAALNFALDRLDRRVLCRHRRRYRHRPRCHQQADSPLRRPARSAPSPATPRSAIASISGPAGRLSNTSPARTSSAAP